MVMANRKKLRARVSARVAFQIERVIEALVTECAQVAFDVAVVLHVTVHESLQFECLRADLALELVLWIVGDLHSREEVNVVVQRVILRILDTISAVNQHLF